MPKPYKFCPFDGQPLTETVHGHPACKCGFVHWDNPVPVVAVLAPMNGGIVAVQRKLEPFAGGWCLPCGFVDSHEDPSVAAVREIKEEAGLDVEPISILRVVTTPGNQTILFFLTKIVGGELLAGDDATVARTFQFSEIPQLCFPLHNEVVREFIRTSNKERLK